MNKPFIILLMIFCHIVADYNLQGWLASAKQKKWWQQNNPTRIYKYDYIWALLIHSFSWTFMIMLPIAMVMNFQIDVMFIVIFIVNVFEHAHVDNEKANRATINLWIDQLIHMLQIILTAIILL